MRRISALLVHFAPATYVKVRLGRKMNSRLELHLSVKVLKAKMNEHPKNPLQNKTLESIVTALVEHYGFPELGERIRINCFVEKPSIKSSLIFLRKTPWARKKVEALFLRTKFNNDKSRFRSSDKSVS